MLAYIFVDDHTRFTWICITQKIFINSYVMFIIMIHNYSDNDLGLLFFAGAGEMVLGVCGYGKREVPVEEYQGVEEL